MRLLRRRSPGLSREKDRPDLEETHISISVAEIVLEPGYQPRKKAAPQKGLLGRDGIQHLDHTVPAGCKRGYLRLEQTGAHQLTPNRLLQLELRMVWYRSRTKWTEVFGKVVVSVRPGHFFDQIHLSLDIVAPKARNLHPHTVLLGFNLQPQRRQQRFDGLRLERNPQYLLHPLEP